MKAIRTILFFAALVSSLSAAEGLCAGGDTPRTSIQLEVTAVPGAGYPIVVANREVFVMRAAIGPVGPADRAAGAVRSIHRIEESGKDFNLEVVAVNESAVAFKNSDEIFFSIVKEDLSDSEKETFSQATERVRASLTTVFTELRESRSPRRLAIQAGKTAAATLVYALLTWFLTWSRRRFELRLVQFAKERNKMFTIGGKPLFDMRHVYSGCRHVMDLVIWGAIAVLSLSWLSYSLQQFPYTRPWGEQLLSSLLQMCLDFGAAVLSSVPGIATIFAIVFVTRLVAKLISLFFRRVEAGEIQVFFLDQETAGPTRRVVLFILWLMVTAAAYPYIPGSSSEAFKGLSVLVGMMLSFGTTNVVGQIVGGLMITYSGALRRGQYIRLNDVEGTVQLIGMLVTRVSTIQGEVVTIPNSVILNSHVINYSRGEEQNGLVALHTTVTIGYDTPWRLVHSLLKQAAARTAGLSPSPEPFVLQEALDDFYVRYRINAYLAVSVEQRQWVLSELQANIQDCFNASGVQIMSPHYFQDPATSKVVPEQNWFKGLTKPAPSKPF